MNLPHKEPSLSGDFIDGEGSFFRIQSNTIKESISQEQYNNLCNLKTDEERIKFINSLEVFHNIKLPLSPFEKSTEKATNFKNQGNTSFGKENYVQAVKYYGFGLIDCPENESILLSTLFANRSAAYYYLQEYIFALQDIELSLSLLYPENLQHKVLERKARCHLALNDLKKAVDAFKAALKALEKSKLDGNNRQKKEHDFSLMITMLSKTLSQAEPPKKKIGTKAVLPMVPPVHGSPNKNIPNASNLVRIEQNPSEGRYAVAEKDIEPGDVLVVENAHCANLLFDFSKTHCQNCFIRVVYLLPCPKCPNVVFCSVKCRAQALASYHKYECSFLGCLWTSGASIVCHLAVRLITQRTLKYFLNIQPALKEKLPENVKYDSSDYKTVYNLCRHENLRTHLDFFQRSVMSVVLLKFLQNSNYFALKSDINNDETTNIKHTTELSNDEVFVGGLLLHNLQMLQFNAHEIAELQFSADYPKQVEKAKSQFIGGGLFPTLALFNHSCEPGIVRYFSGSKVIVRAVKPIQSGELIAENYGPIYTEARKEERQAELKLRYWFECHCIPCVKNWPIFDEMKTDILTFRCAKSRLCPGQAIVPLTTEEFMFPCSECKENIVIFGSLKALNDTEEMFKKGENFMKNRLYQDALNVFLKIMKLLDNILRPPYKDFCLCQQKIRSVMLTFGNIHQPTVTAKIGTK